MIVMRIVLLGMVLALGGCAVGQTFSYADTDVVLKPAADPGSLILLAVLDQRAYILDGRKKDSFVGLSRGGFGNPYNVDTRSGVPLATEMAISIAAALRASGYEVRSVTVKPGDGVEGATKALLGNAANRFLLLTLHEWKTDTLARTGLHFDLAVEVFDGSGQSLATHRVSGFEVSGGSILSAEKDAQKWFEEKIGELLREEQVAAKLRET